MIASILSLKYWHRVVTPNPKISQWDRRLGGLVVRQFEMRLAYAPPVAADYERVNELGAEWDEYRSRLHRWLQALAN